MSVFKARGGYVAKFQHEGKQHWTPGGPWPTKRQATEAQRRHRDRLEARRTEETCASFAERWLEEWPRAATSSPSGPCTKRTPTNARTASFQRPRPFAVSAVSAAHA